jgi:ribosome-associated protein
MLHITPRISIPESELEEEFIRSPGPGGQHVNKTSTAVRLLFNAAISPALPDDVRHRLLQLAGSRATSQGVVIIECSEHRSQNRNRETARERLAQLVRDASRPPKKRKKSKPSRASKERRLSGKKARSDIKRMRGRVSRDD